MTRNTIAVALSGGVDSSVAAYLLKEQGYDVIGVHLLLFEPDFQQDKLNTSENTIAEINEFCKKTGIPFCQMDLRAEFKEYVINYFCREYAAGRTPNPCVACNKYIKFGFLFDRLNDLDAGYLATGHYASVRHYDDAYHLLIPEDKRKDQTYMLYVLDQKKLNRIVFPLEGYSKKNVMDIATDKGFPSAGKSSSQDICFVKNNYAELLEQVIKPLPGEIVDTGGNIIGKYNGLIYYTVGQRHNLGISANKKLYVSKIDYENNVIVVGGEQELLHKTLLATDINWINNRQINTMNNIGIKIRYGMKIAAGDLELAGTLAYVRFKQPQRAISPGQSVVFYQDSEVLGGGIIENWAD